MENCNILLEFIHQSASPFHCVEQIKRVLIEANFTELQFNNSWDLKKGCGYFVTQNDSSIYAFLMGHEPIEENGCRIIAAHSDSPTLKIKPVPEFVHQGKYIKMHTEVYGSPILMSWLDRPLSVAGRISIKSSDAFKPETRLVNIKEPIAIIPNLAIHLNRTVNEGVELKKHIDILPLLGTLTEGLEKENVLLKKIAQHINISIDDILDFDLNLYEAEKGQIVGINNEFISSGRLDDLAMVYSGLIALVSSKPSAQTKMLAIFDNEEVGSFTKQGAGSPILKHIIARIANQNHNATDSLFRTIANSFMISADMAHAVHPNKAELHDPHMHPVLNGGPVIKYSANQKYTTDSQSAAVFKQLCMKANVPFQQFSNRADMAGGSTLGNVSISQMEIETVDIGNPMLSMHSIRELAGVKDVEYIEKVFKEFYK